MHCTFPVAGADDLARDVLLLGRSKFAHDLADLVNWVDRTGTVMLSKVNVCSHLARECTCLGLYGPSYVFAMHSAYYFEDSDWDQLFRYTDDVQVGLHLPERDGQAVPSDMPEFRWQYLNTTRELMSHFGVVRGISAIAERVYLGVEHVAFKPLSAHGTTYCHRNIAKDVERGGFHVVKYSRVADEVIRNAATAAAVSIGVGCAVATIPSIIGDVLARRSPWWNVAKAAACAAPAWLLSGVAVARNSAEPPSTAQYTVKVIPGWDYVRQGETICQVYQFRRAPVSHLESRTITTRRPHPAKVKEMAASMVLSNNPDKALRAVSAMGFRAGLAPNQVRDTVEAAKEYCSMVVEPKNESDGGVRACGPGSDPVLSAWDLTPSGTARQLGKALLVGGLTKELYSMSDFPAVWMPLEEYRDKWKSLCTIAVGTRGSGGRAMSSIIHFPWTRWEETKSALVRAFAELHSLGVPSSPIVQSWPSMLWPSATSPPPRIAWGGSQ
jgi:hypothetical protein